MEYKIREIFFDSWSDAIREFKKIGSTPPGSKIMASKLHQIILKVSGLDPKAANILKQEMLARGGDVATARDVLTIYDKKTDVIVFGNKKAFLSLIEKLKLQPFGLKRLSSQISAYLDKKEEKKKIPILRAGKYSFDLKNTKIMGILNITPDSFSDGGRYLKRSLALKRAEELIEEGADIIDVGGLSTRPGSLPVSEEEEAQRVLPVIEEIIDRYDFPVSVDTYRSAIAKRSLEKGACIINDISAARFDSTITDVAAGYDAGLVMMHMQGIPSDMQKEPYYKDVIQEIFDFLEERSNFALDKGLNKENIIIDPGIGFGKELEHNLEILRQLKDFKSLGYPLLLGVSRKSFLGMISGSDVGDRLEESIAASLWGVLHATDILRVHDVAETKKALRIIEAIKDTKEGYEHEV